MKGLQFGVDYYPEHWDKSRWRTDLSMMKEMGIDLVRMAEFSWSLLETSENKFNFAWLDEVIELCAEYDIKVVLGTPTAAPPAWIIEQAPDIQPMASDGTRRYFGGRHHSCHSHREYRKHIERFVTRFVKHFTQNEQVIGWQIDNELGNSHGDLCYCEHCESRFREWLKEKYSTIDQVNKNWGTAFWSQGYNSFDQIHSPKVTASGQNPSRSLDWKLFHSDLINEFHAFQAKIIRQYSADRFLTHNLMGFSNIVNYHDLAKQLDFVSHDQYVEGYWRDFDRDQLAEERDAKYTFPAAELDFIRSINKDNFWIMEQQTSISGWEILGRTPKPGQISLWSVQSVAHGADTIVYFRWRSSPMGTEQYWHGILPHSGIPGRSYNEIKALITKVKPLMQEINGSLPQPKVALVHSYAQHYAMEIQPHNPDLNYIDHLHSYYRELHRRNIPVDFVRELEDWSQYSIVIAPLQYLMSPEQEEHFASYVKNGGRLVVTMRTGVKERNNLNMLDKALPGNLSKVFGVEIHEYDSLRRTQVKVDFAGVQSYGNKWADILVPTTANPLAYYDSEFYAGEAAITVNAFGEGQAYYVGTQLDKELMSQFIDELTQGCIDAVPTPAGVEIAYREQAEKSYYFVLNHNDQAIEINLPTHWESYFDDQNRTLIEGNAYQVYYLNKK